MSAPKDYRKTFIRKGSEKKVVEAYNLFGYKLESFQYLETDSEPWEKYIYAFNENEIYDALGAYPSSARIKPYPFPGYVTMVFSLDPESPDAAYYYNVYRLYRRVQFGVFTCSEHQKKQRKKMITPLTFWILYLLIALLGALAIGGMHFYQQRQISAGSSGVLFSFSLISQYFETFNDFLSSKAYVIGICLIGVGLGLLVFHILWDLIFHGIKASVNGSSKKSLIKMRDSIIGYVKRKKYPVIDMEKLRAIENSRGIYNSTKYTSQRRRKEDATFKRLAAEQNQREYQKIAKQAARRKRRASPKKVQSKAVRG